MRHVPSFADIRSAGNVMFRKNEITFREFEKVKRRRFLRCQLSKLKLVGITWSYFFHFMPTPITTKMNRKWLHCEVVHFIKCFANIRCITHLISRQCSTLFVYLKCHNLVSLGSRHGNHLFWCLGAIPKWIFTKNIVNFLFK